MILHAAHAIMSVSERQEDEYKVIIVKILIKMELFKKFLKSYIE